MAEVEKVQTRHPDPEKSGPRIEKTRYEHYRKAILGAVPATEEGTTFRELPDRVRRRLPRDLRGKLGSIPWYTVTIKLDLEARGEIERVPGSRPQRVRRIRR